jgi:IS30 family transposase
LGHHYRHIDMAERRQIMKLLERKVPSSQIANIVGRHHSTIYCGLHRNFFRDKCPDFQAGFRGQPANLPASGGLNATLPPGFIRV